MVWATVRANKVEPIAMQLKEIGVTGCTVYPVRGYGEQWTFHESIVFGGHYKLEVIVEEDQVAGVMEAIIAKGSTGVKGDGILSVLDLGSVVKIRSRGKS